MPAFKTTDIHLSAALKTIGFKLIDIEKDDRGRGVFVFEDREDRETIVKDYFAGNLQGSLKSFTSNWLDLKNFIIQLGIEKNVRIKR